MGKKCTLTTESFVTEGRPNTKEDQTIFDLLIHKILDKDGNLLLKNDQEVDQRVSVLPSEVNHYAWHITGVLKQKLKGGVIEGGRIVID